MLISLKLQNFKKHENLTITFTEGLNVIRGLNENGKSTVVQAVAYALYGARALPLALDETVTWGKPASSLKVELVFQHDNQMYTIVRSKSGAELVGESVKSSGQTEVTAFIERLFNAAAAVGQATMLTNQSALQAGLDSSSMSLIEKLANMNFVDELVGKIQEQLPTGSTKFLESQLASTEGVAAPVPPGPELENAATNAVIEALGARGELKIAKETLASWEPLAQAAAQKTASNRETSVHLEKVQKELKNLPTELTLQPVPDIEQLEQAAARQAEHKALQNAWVKFQEIPHQGECYGTVEELQKEDEWLTAQIQKLQVQRQDCQVAIAGLKPLLITESACGLCGKDLSQVPEVAKKNIDTQLKISATEAALKTAEVGLETELARKREILKYDKMFDAVEKFVGTPFVEFDTSVVPPKATWVGGKVSAEEDTTDYKAKIRSAKLQASLNEKAVKEYEVSKAKREILEKQIAEATYYKLSQEELEASEKVVDLKEQVGKASVKLKALETVAANAEATLSKARAVHEAKSKAWEDLQKTRDILKSGIAEQQRNNSLVKKLRDVRPLVAKQLWGIVLSAVSHYFSSVRGVQSVVTREGTGFAIDGKVLEAYSGSTKDALALAVRVVLQKTFLPNIDFAIFDEVASACDDSRESEMLAMLSTCGLRQVLLVTHSDLADSYAANVIRI
jgi:exonuclease SbcC